MESAGGEVSVFKAASVEGATDQEIIAAFRKARDEEFAALAPILLAIREPVVRLINPESDIVTPAFDAAFARRLQIFHALHDPNDCLNKRAFEFAFKDCLTAQRQENSAEHRRAFACGIRSPLARGRDRARISEGWVAS